MALFNETGMIGSFITSMTVNVTGSLFLTLFTVMILFVLIATSFRLPIWITVPLVLPFLFVALLMSGEFLVVLGVTLIYLAVVFSKALFF